MIILETSLNDIKMKCLKNSILPKISKAHFIEFGNITTNNMFKILNDVLVNCNLDDKIDKALLEFISEESFSDIRSAVNKI